MAIIGGELGYRALRTIAPRRPGDGGPDDDAIRLTECFGSDFYDLIRGRTVIDFGCGKGRQAVEMAVQGAGRVIGLDLQERMRQAGTALAASRSVSATCTFVDRTDEKADFIISKDAFEHFNDPAEILRIMRGLIKPDGQLLAAFGPTWLHPYGGHLFSVFPWAHLLFTEASLIRWRSDFKSDGARRFAEIDGGLNQLTVRRFEQIVEASPFRCVHLETVPIRGIGLFRHRLLREFGSSIVRCRLVPR